MKIILPVLVSVCMLTGCVSTGHVIEQPTAKIAIQYGAMKFIHNDPVRAAKVKDVTLRIRRSLDGDTTTSIDLIKTTIQGYLPPDMSPEDRFAVNSLIDLVVAELNARINEQMIPADATLQIKTVADWIIEAASYYPAPSVPEYQPPMAERPT